MGRVSWARVVAVAVALVMPARSAGAAEWEPGKTWVFAVGVTEWKTWKKGRMEKKGRRDAALVAALRARGVPENRTVYLKDRAATLGAIRRGLASVCERSRPGDWFVFYFQGHGTRDLEGKRARYYFMNYDADDDRDGSYWPMGSVVDALERGFRGDRVLLWADCCHSGGVLEAVKARRPSRLSYACLTSVFGHTGSSGEWTYTDCLIRGLTGDPVVDRDGDGDGDGVVSLDELAGHVKEEMAFFEQQKAVSLWTGRLDGATRLGPARRKPHPDVGKHVEVRDEGKWSKAEIVAAGADRVRVRWVEYEGEEWFARKLVRDYRPRALAPGSKVSARSDEDDRWHPATVVQAWNGLHFVHFDHKPAALDEWVGPDRLRPAR